MREGRQIQHASEAIVLRTWPFHEADLLVSLFTREQGKVKGVARHAMKSRRRFGGALEPATVVRASWTERPKQDLARLDAFEITWSPLSAPVDSLRLAGMQFVAEVLEEAMPEGAPEDHVFRLAVACLTRMHEGDPASVRLAVMYFAMWMDRLMGWWPELGACSACGLDLRDQDVWWSPNADGVTCADDRRGGSRSLSAASVAEAHRMARVGLPELAVEEWTPERVAQSWAQLGTFAAAVLERHLERRIRSAVSLISGA